MIDFAECDSIIDGDDIPPFISIDDILNRSLDLFKDINAVAIYKTNGTCIKIKERKKKVNIRKKTYQIDIIQAYTKIRF